MKPATEAMPAVDAFASGKSVLQLCTLSFKQNCSYGFKNALLIFVRNCTGRLDIAASLLLEKYAGNRSLQTLSENVKDTIFIMRIAGP